MKNKIEISEELLRGTGVSVVDAARVIKNILDFLPKGSKLTPLQFCSKVADLGRRHFRLAEMSFKEAFPIYLESKSSLRKDSLNDIKYLGAKLIKVSSKFAGVNFSEFTVSDCEEWLNLAFKTPSMFNKGRAFLHAIFEFALRKNWCEKNPIRQISRKKVIEKEIQPLTLSEIESILTTSRLPKFKECLPAAALLIFAGIRPREVRRLCWRDIDLSENAITVRSICSKTGGARQVEICASLRKILSGKIPTDSAGQKICPKNWAQKWRKIRDLSGFKGVWVQDVLRHTYASYFAKRFSDLPRLQLNMGHSNLSLLRSRYLNLSGLSASSAKTFFN
ncbi:MAG: tyrosine-type recombinase/integrase [Opitutales bacterium]|nr:tyrosine-type recombinase/integrase [Opitutales bacterium]